MAKGFGTAVKSFKNLKKMWRNSEIKGKMADLPDGVYQGKLKSASLATTRDKKLPNAKFLFEVIGGDYDGQKIVINHVLVLDNTEQLEMKLSQLKTTLSLWFHDEATLNLLGETLFDQLEKSSTGNDVVWISAKFEEMLGKLVGSELEFKVQHKKKDGKDYMNIYLNDLISAPELEDDHETDGGTDAHDDGDDNEDNEEILEEVDDLEDDEEEEDED